MNVFFDANYVSEDSAKIRYAVSLLRGPTMDWWCVIVTKPVNYKTVPTREGQTGPWASSYFVEVPQHCTWDAWCARLRARLGPIAALIAARQKLRTWRQLDSVQDYTSGFLALCKKVGYMHEGERIDHYIGGLKHKIAQEIQLRNVTECNKILAMAEKLEFLRRPRSGIDTIHTKKIRGISHVDRLPCTKLGYDTIKSCYPIPRAGELVDQLRTARVFLKIDLQGGYHQIRVNPPDCLKTAFRTRYGSFKYTVMPFGQTNAPATFKMTMNEAFRPLLDTCVIVYLDDILIHSPDRAHHLQDVE
ncbi:unnamed protein product [Closterium sp. NIES-54]